MCRAAFVFLVLRMCTPVFAQNWIASIVSKQVTEEHKLILSVAYNDGKQAVIKEYTFDGSKDIDAQLKQYAADEIENLKAVDRAAAVIVIGQPVTPTEPTPEPVSIPSDANREKFAKALQDQAAAQKAIALGLIRSDDPIAEKAATAYREAFKPEYVDMLK